MKKYITSMIILSASIIAAAGDKSHVVTAGTLHGEIDKCNEKEFFDYYLNAIKATKLITQISARRDQPEMRNLIREIWDKCERVTSKSESDTDLEIIKGKNCPVLASTSRKKYVQMSERGNEDVVIETIKGKLVGESHAKYTNVREVSTESTLSKSKLGGEILETVNVTPYEIKAPKQTIVRKMNISVDPNTAGNHHYKISLKVNIPYKCQSELISTGEYRDGKLTREIKLDGQVVIPPQELAEQLGSGN